MRRIAIVSQSGSRNRGCEALVYSALLGLRALPEFSGVAIDLHSLDCEYDKWRFRNQCSYVFATSLKFRALHTRFLTLNKLIYRAAALAENCLLSSQSHRKDFSSCLAADMILCTGGDNFSVDYGAFHSHAAYLNLGVPVFMCGQSIGPFPKREENYFKNSTNNVRLITARESHSYEYMKSLNLSSRVEQTADVAFLLPVMSRDETLDYAQRFFNVNLAGHKLAGLSASALITKYYKYGHEEGIKQIAHFVDRLNERGYGVVFIPHVSERRINNDDQAICADVLRQTKDPAANISMSGLFSCVEAKSIVGLCDVLIGARTHTTIASMSQGIPTVAIAYSRKAYGIMEDYYGLELSKKLIVPADQVFTERLLEATDAALASGRHDETAQRMKTLAAKNFSLLAETFPTRP